MMGFLYKHECKFIIIGIIIFAVGSMFLPSESIIEPIWVKTFDMVVGANEFNTAYFLFTSTPSIVIVIICGAFFGMKKYQLAKFLGFIWCMCAFFYGILSCLFNTVYLFSSIFLFICGLLIILIAAIDEYGAMKSSTQNDNIINTNMNL